MKFILNILFSALLITLIIFTICNINQLNNVQLFCTFYLCLTCLFGFIISLQMSSNSVSF